MTGHFAPGRGGVERFTTEIIRRLPSDQVVLAAPGDAATEGSDRQLPYPVYRYGRKVFANPTLPAALAAIADRHDCQAAWITSGLPLGVVAPALRRAGVRRIVVSTHGLETGWAGWKVAAAALRRATQHVDVVTYLGRYTRDALSPALAPSVEPRQLAGGVDTGRFSPAMARPELREELGLADRRVIVSASRLVRRKGQDRLLRAWPALLRRHPDAALLVVGDGHLRPALERLTRRLRLVPHVRFVGSVADEQLAQYLALGELFAMPCRTMWWGMQVEGLGLSILEASATGLPVVVGRSGGAPDALIDGHTGVVVDDWSADGLATLLGGLLDDPVRLEQMGVNGRSWVEDRWSWEDAADRLAGYLHGSVSVAPSATGCRAASDATPFVDDRGCG
ncbi:MAG TPA: glycosyltransferase family 4 protein [Mycobacteriales bacterium]|nr:glycosyltransferase family 4 protein [Mycobacteriales bacterium]